jgi:hypothetical protein
VEPLREYGGSAERTKFIPKTVFVKASLGVVGLLARTDEKEQTGPAWKMPPKRHHVMLRWPVDALGNFAK